MADQPTQWFLDEQQASFIAQTFDLKLHPEPITIGLADIDHEASKSIGQNRTEMTTDEETVELLALYMAEGVAFPMPLVWKREPRSKRVVKLDGNHRIEAALVKRGEPSCPAVLVTGETQLAQYLAMVVNTQHGRSTRTPDYLATAMRQLRDANVSIPQIAAMFGVTPARVGLMTRREVQAERVRVLVPERRSMVKYHTLDLLGQLEDEHVRILGDVFLDAPRSAQEEAIRRIKEAPSAQRDAVAHEIIGELREIDRQRRKVKASTSKPSSNLQGALERLKGVADPTRAFYASTDQQKAIMRANLAVVLPRLQVLWQTITDRAEVA